MSENTPRLFSSKRIPGEREETHLEETDGRGLLTEALTAEVEAVLADETSLVGAEAAVKQDTEPPLTTTSSQCTVDESYAPLTAALSVLAGTREPNGVVGHFGGF